jgi:hypothetical protein
MVGAEHVDAQIESALPLVQVVGEVAGDVGGLAVTLDDDAILIIAELGGAQPGCAVLLVDRAVGPQLGDGLVDPALNRFNVTGICSRYLDSNGYSLRAGGVDLAASHRLRLQQQGSQLLLLARSITEPRPLVVARGASPLPAAVISTPCNGSPPPSARRTVR